MAVEGEFDKVDGDILFASEVNAFETRTKNIISQQLEQDINILINSAASASTLEPYEDMFLDIFNTAAGFDGTVNLGNTTATHDSGNEVYKNNFATILTTDGHGETQSTTAATTAFRGLKITTNFACTLLKITKPSNANPTTARLFDSGKSQLAVATYSGDVATFNFALADATTFYVGHDSGGASYTQSFKVGASFPYNRTNVNFTGSLAGTTDSTVDVLGPASIETEITGDPIDGIVETNAITITSNPVGHQLFCHNAVAGSGSVDYDVSFDNGVTFETGQSLNTINADVHTGSQMIIKLNLNGVGLGNTSEASDYALMLFY